MAQTEIQRRIAAATGMNKKYNRKQRKRAAYNTFRRKSNGGAGG